MQRTRFLQVLPARAAWIVAIALVAVPPAATAETLMEANGAVNLRYDRTEAPQTEFQGRQVVQSRQVDLRPSVLIQVGSPRLVWRGAYLFSGTFGIGGGAENSYSNNLDLSLAAQITERSALTLTGRATQGASEFRLSQRAPEAGEPALRARGNPVLVSALLEEEYGWESMQRFRLEQHLAASMTALQDALDRVNLVLNGTLELERLYPRDIIGIVYAPRLAVLRPLDTVGAPETGGAPSAKTVTNSVLGSWNHDLDPRWNAQAMAGAEHVNPLGSRAPSSIHPTGSLTVRYLAGDVEGSLTLTRGAVANLETGSMTLSDAAVLRGAISFGPTRQLAASAGFLRSRPLAGVSSVSADALNGDVGLIWGLWEGVLANARYSVAYQFGEAGGEGSSLVHVALVGITARYGNTPYVPPVPTLGGERVDGGDAVAFPGEERAREPSE